uniref:Malectin-like domain-containing protein n=1 Tax=Salix viminalis TaxID=40686 RepID=A0A6N2KHV1_SALVM
MISTHPFPLTITDYDSMSSKQQSLEFTTKNVPLIYKGSTLRYFTGIDFSCNNFTGEISPEIGNLSKIKVKGNKSLDLSYNKLEGEIPPQLVGLYFLAVFSVAHNNLSGKTPARVAQFATFEESCYKDNTFLVDTVNQACDVDMPPHHATSMNNEDNGGFMDMKFSM